MVAKLKIDMAQGLLEVEGDESFVREVLEKFQLAAKHGLSPKSEVSAGGAEARDPTTGGETMGTTKTRGRRRRRTALATSQDTSKRTQVGSYEPRIDPDLKPDGIEAFLAQYAPNSHPEYILIFAMYLRLHHTLETVTGDQIYTCYRFAKVKWAKAYMQSIRDTQTKKSWISFDDPMQIRVTNLGEQYFEHDLKRAGATE